MRMSQHAARMLHVAAFVATASIGVVLVRPDLAAHAPLISTAAAQTAPQETVASPEAAARPTSYPVLGSYPRPETTSPGASAPNNPWNESPPTSRAAVPAVTTPVISAPVDNAPAIEAPAARPAVAPAYDRPTNPGLAPQTTSAAPATNATLGGREFPFPEGPASIRDRLPQPEPIDGGRVVARVGSEVILAVELLQPLAHIDAMLAQQQMSVVERAAKRRELVQQALDQAIDSKLRYLAAKLEIPEEGFPKVEENVAGFFEDKQIPLMIERAGVKNRTELEAYLADQGENLDRIKRTFVEQMIGVSFRDQKVGDIPEIPHSELFDYYQAHLDDYKQPARARWRCITVTYGPAATAEQRHAALVRICEAGNRLLGSAGRPRSSFAEVAQEFSDGPRASFGGEWDWTDRGALKSQLLDQAIFTLPVGRPSKVIEEDGAFHIVEVTERNDGGRRSFLEVQKEIREHLENEERRRLNEAYMKDIRRAAPVVTIFDNDQLASGAGRDARR